MYEDSPFRKCSTTTCCSNYTYVYKDFALGSGGGSDGGSFGSGGGGTFGSGGGSGGEYGYGSGGYGGGYGYGDGTGMYGDMYPPYRRSDITHLSMIEGVMFRGTFVPDSDTSSVSPSSPNPIPPHETLNNEVHHHDFSSSKDDPPGTFEKDGDKDQIFWPKSRPGGPGGKNFYRPACKYCVFVCSFPACVREKGPSRCTDAFAATW
jgi:hypothetical protein